MTDREKVIKGLQYCLDGKDCTECPYDDDADYLCEHVLRNDALALLKAQEPKPVKVVKNAYNHEFYHCPNCDREFYGPYKRPNYCDQCGKAVKWE